MQEEEKNNPGLSEIDSYIRKGIHQAKQMQHNRIRKRRIRVASSLIACSLLFVFVFSIRLSPAVAAYVSTIPGMEKLVEIIRDDKGLQLAAENHLIQNIGAGASLGDVTFTIDQVLADEKRMLLFYTLKNPQKDKQVALDRIELFDVSGKQWEYSANWSSMHTEESETSDRVDINIMEATEIPDTMRAKVILEIDNLKQEDTPLWIDFQVDKNKYKALEKKVYPVGKEITVDGQRFTIEQIVVFPTQTEVSIRFDPANTKHVFDFDQLRLVNEKGETFAFWGNGVPYRDNGENGKVYNLESVYFVEPEQLYLKANGIRALEKDQLEVVIDAQKSSFIKVPNDRLQLTALRQVNDIVGMDFSLRVPPQDFHAHISIGDGFTDNLGNQYEYVQSTSSTSSTDDSIQEYSLLYKRVTNKGMPTQYRFTLSSYPERLTGTFSVQIK